MTKARKAADSLQHALDTFAASNRFGFLRSLQIGRLIGDDDSFGAVSDLTCDMLVELGADGVRTGYRLTAAQTSRLAELILALGNGSTETSSEPGPHLAAGTPSSASSQEPLFNSVQVELDLKRSIEAVRAHPTFSDLRSMALGRFWDATWPRAPFEEALTVGQLVDMDLGLLFKKRSTSGSRVHYITMALGRAVEQQERGQTLRRPEPASAISLRSVVAPASYAEHPWSEAATIDEVPVTPATLALVESFISATRDLQSAGLPLSSLMATLPHYLSRAEFLAVLADGELSPRISAQLGKWHKEQAHAPCVALVREALQTPGCAVASLARIVSDEGRYTAFSGMAAIVLARALKAEQVRYENQVCSGMWSLNPSLITLVINEAKRRKPKDVAKTVHELCPALDPILQTWICGVVAPLTSRKGKRKGK